MCLSKLCQFFNFGKGKKTMPHFEFNTFRHLISHLEMVARVNPQAWELVGGGGPHGGDPRGMSLSSQFSATAQGLNPQPIPPYVGLVVQATRNIVQAALTLQAGGVGGTKMLHAEIDEMCGNGRFSDLWELFRHFRPLGGEPPPRPEELQAIATASFLSIAMRMERNPVRDALEAGVDKLLQVGMRGQSTHA
jgi:hypothetical protein